MLNVLFRDFMPKYASNFSAFTARVEPGRRQEEFGQVKKLKLILKFIYRIGKQLPVYRQSFFCSAVLLSKRMRL